MFKNRNKERKKVKHAWRRKCGLFRTARSELTKTTRIGLCGEYSLWGQDRLRKGLEDSSGGPMTPEAKFPEVCSNSAPGDMAANSSGRGKPYM